MSRVKEIIHPLPPDKGFLPTWNKYFLTEICRNMQAFAFQALRECSSWASRNGAVQMDFFAFFLPGIFSWKLAFVSFSKASKTFLAPALPESRRGP